MDEKGTKRSASRETDKLRRQAEQRLDPNKTKPSETTAGGDLRALVHELQIHQIELEMQNDELRRAEAAAQVLSDKYSDLFDFAPIAYFRLDESGQILEVNLAVAALLAQNRGAVVKKRFAQFVAMEDRTEFAEFRRQVLQADTRQVGEFRLLKGSQTVIALLDGIAVRDKEGKATGCRIAVTDITERKRAEEALRESHERLKKVLEVETVGVMFWDLTTGCMTDANDTFLKMMGYSRREVEARELTWQKLTAPECMEASLTEIRKFHATGRVGPYEKEYIRKDGTRRWLLFAGSSLGHNTCVEFCVDIADRKRAEEVSRESQAKLEAALASMTDAVFISDTAGRFINFNDAFATFHRFKTKDECAKTLAEYPDIIDVFMADGKPATLDQWAVSRALRGETVTNAEYTMRRKDTGETWVGSYNFAPIRDKDGLIVGSVVTGCDITERKRVELRIQHLNEVLRAVRDIGDLIVRERNADRLLAEACNALIRTRGYRLVWIGGVVSDSKRVVPLASAGPAADYLADVTVTWDESETGRGPLGTALRERATIVCQDTSTDPRFAPWLKPALARGYRSVAAVPMIHDGRLFGVAAVYADRPAAFDDEELDLLAKLASDLAFGLQAIEDEHERRQAEESLVHAKIAAEAANRAKSEFLANMSHEIRTPMTAVLGFSDLLTSPNLSHDERRQFLDGMRRNGMALLDLINNILDLSRIEADKLTLERTDCPVRQIIDDVMSTVTDSVVKKRLSLVVDYRWPLPETIHTDPARLRQILVNLVSNAIKFTEQGEIRIAVRCEHDDHGPARMTFAVSDTGIGIPTEKIGELFQPFTQVDGSMSRRYGGTGLGLAISKRLATALGGNIEVISELGEGSTFTVTIDAGPLRGVRMLQSPELAVAAGEESSSEEQKPMLQGRVLLVEDVPGVQFVLGQILQKLNLQVEIAEDGLVACRMAEKSQAEGSPYDLILMDIQMPTMNGYEATRWLHDHGWQGPIVALTAHAMVGDREKCLAAGCDDYLSKPVNAKELRDVLERYLGSTAGDS